MDRTGHRRARSLWLVLAIALAVLLSACGTTKRVEPGHYRVVAGDTLSSIARKHGQSVSALMRMNNISNPNRLEVGQILRVQAGAGSTPSSSGSSNIPVTRPVPPTQKPPPKTPAPPRSIALVWPADGTVNRTMPKPSPHGLFIVNQAGTPVKAVADGSVIYAGNGLRGYGNLAIVRHASGFLSVYAHNRSLAVKEGQNVKQGQKIAEMGNTENSAVALYFELRYDGKATDATRFLPKR
ncbi:MAG: peptidoglycan DD-metalloendopeptidase family protein [Candidimonas sp.]